MLTRRQARLLGLTTSDETSAPSNAVAASTGTTALSSDVYPSNNNISDDGKPSSAVGASSGVSSNGISAEGNSFSSGPSGPSSSSSSSIVLRLNRPAGGALYNDSLRSAAQPYSSSTPNLTSYASSNSNSSNTNGNTGSYSGHNSSAGVGGLRLYVGRGRLGARQAEAMLTSAQSTLEYWSAAGTTAGPVIRPNAAHGIRRFSYGSASPSETGQRGCSVKSSTAEDAAESSRSGVKKVLADGVPTVSTTSSTATAQRPPRLTAAQLRARWRGVVRNCTTLQVHSRSHSSSSSGNNNLSTAPVTAPASSTPSSSVRDGASDRLGGAAAAGGFVARRGETAHTQHTLQLSGATAPRAGDNNVNCSAKEQNGNASAEMRTFAHTYESHRDMTPAPEVPSRRSATYFVSPFYSDAFSSSHAHSRSSGRATMSSPSSLSLHIATRHKLLTALGLRQHAQTQSAAQQRQLCHEVYNQVYVKAHEARMRMLFGLEGSMHSDGDGAPSSPRRSETHAQNTSALEDSVASGEAAYLRSLDANKSEEEAKVLQVIAAIDAALKRQLASAYQHPWEEGGGAESGGHRVLPLPSSTQRARGVRTRVADGESPTAPSLATSFAARRPAIMEAVMASTTSHVEAFVDQLLPYQQEGVRWLLRLNTLEHMNGILADDMGLGKTAQTVVYLSCYKDMVESVVQRPLQVLRHQHLQLCQRALGLTSSGPATTADAELPPWLAWCAGAALEDEKENNGEEQQGSWTEMTYDEVQPIKGNSRESGGGGGGGGNAAAHARSTAPSSAPANPLVTAARQCGRTIQLVKEVKRWLWQLDEATLAKTRSSNGTRTVTATSAPSVSLTRSPATSSRSASSSSPSVIPSSTTTTITTAAAAAPAATATAVNVVSLLPLKRRRGRPPKHLAAMIAAANAAAGANSNGGAPHLLSSASRSPLTSSPVPQSPLTPSQSLSAMLRQQTRLTTCPDAVLDDQLEHEFTSFRPVLIIAPLSTLPHWAGEFQRFSRRRASPSSSMSPPSSSGETTSAGGKGAKSHGDTTTHALPSNAPSATTAGAGDTEDRFTVYVLNGPRAERESRMRVFLEHVQTLEEPSHPSASTNTFKPTPVLVIPHDMLTKPLSGSLRRIARVQWHVVVIDEAQRIKSAQSTLYKKVRLLQSVSRLVLTGTPLQNNTTELFSLLQFLAPHSFTASASDLFEQLDSALMAASRSSALEDRELHILLCRRVHRLLMPFILRREKTILKSALPPLRDYAVLCPLLPFQATQLEEVRRKHQEGTLSGNPHIQYRKILLHPYTTQAFFYVDEQVVQTSGKLLVLDFMMRFLQRTRHKFLIFCGWTLVLDVVETLCGMRNIPYVRLDGKTSVEKREANIEGFNRPMRGRADRGGEGEAAEKSDDDSGDDAHSTAPAPCCFLISKVAGGVGLNLQAADTVFLLDVDYNPQRDAQALSRVYRVGQTREVRVFRLVIDHPIERDIVAIHEAKEHLGRAVVQAGRYDLHSSVQEREEALQEIFRTGTLSRLSQQWSDDAPTSPPRASVAADRAGTHDESSDAEVASAGSAGGDDGSEVADGETGSDFMPNENDNNDAIGSEEDAFGFDGEREIEVDQSDGVISVTYGENGHREMCRLGAGDRHSRDAEFPAAPPIFAKEETVDEENLETFSKASPLFGSPAAHTPTDLHRVLLLGSHDPMPSASKKLKTETTATAVGSGADDVPGRHSHINSNNICKDFKVAYTVGSQSLVDPSSNSSSSSTAPRRKRRHISFKLEGESGAESSKNSSSCNTSGGVMDESGVKAEDDAGASHSAHGGKLYRASPPPPTTASSSCASASPPSLPVLAFSSPSSSHESHGATRDGDGQSDAVTEVRADAAVSPAARLLAMRERLEEILLRHDGERGVLHDMFRSLEASIASENETKTNAT